VSSSASSTPARVEKTDDERARKFEADLEKKKKELDELKKSFADVRDELKATKKRVFDQGQAEKTGDDLTRARAEVERTASIQLEATRAELATALADVQRLKSLDESRGKKKPFGASAPEAASVERVVEKPAEKPVVERPQEVITRVIRELSDVEKERIARLETQSSNDRKKANELDRELRSLRAKVDRMQRESKRVYTEANLTRDKFRAVEVRLNRTLMENDLLRRAVVDLEKKTGQHAEHTTLTAAEVADSDRHVKERHAAEDRAEDEARAKLEAAAPVVTEEPVAAAPVEAAPAAPAEPTPAPTPTASA
jgi:archaellum component FlaC